MNFKKLDAFLDSMGAVYGLHGFDFKIMQDHQQLYRYMWGHSDYALTKPVSPDDLYNVYSCTKVVTMTACMQLIEKGLIGLDDPVAKYIPEFANVKVADHFEFGFPIQWPKAEDPQHPAENVMTIRHLMSMSGGLTYDLDYSGLQELVARNPDADTVEIAKAIAGMPLIFEPGTSYAYSLCHDVMAAVAEVVTGKRFGDYLQESIFGPLNLKNMYMHVPESEAHRLSAQYSIPFGKEELEPADTGNRFRLTRNHDCGGAGLATNVDDYSLIMDALACGGVAYNGYRILTQESIDLMRTPQLTALGQEQFDRMKKGIYSYGLGVRTMIDATKSRSPVGEFGWDGAAGAYVAVDPTNHLSFFYAQEVLGMMKSYFEIHPRLLDLVYECMNTPEE